MNERGVRNWFVWAFSDFSVSFCVFWKTESVSDKEVAGGFSCCYHWSPHRVWILVHVVNDTYMRVPPCMKNTLVWELICK